jgi:hypothetical protein
MPNFPQSAPVKKLNQEHPDYSFYKETYDQIDALYEGGVKIREAVVRGGQFLVKNPKELPEVFATRQLRFSYTNLLGNIIGWYISALFKQAPQIIKKREGAAGEAATKIPEDIAAFCAAFEKDCDRGQTELNGFWGQVAETALLYRCAYVLKDLPAPGAGDDMPLSLQQQKQQGLLDPYLVLYRPANVINWETDAHGNLEWIIIYARVQEQEFLGDPAVTDYWYFFDRQQVVLYEREVKTGNVSTDTGGQEEMAMLVEGYPRRHAMTDQDQVPICKIELPEGLWLANRVFLPLVNHLNQDNALDFGLMQANLPQLVIEDGDQGSYEEPVTISAVGYHHIPHGGKMYYLEPQGKAYEASQKRIDGLEERVYRACYLMDQARTNRSTPTAQSGVSKQQDKTPSRDALSKIGDVLRPAMQNAYRDVLAIAGYDNIEPDVRGFDFSDRATAEDMSLLEQASVVEVNSPTYERELGKKAVRLTLPDLNPETLEEIDGEIETNPTPSAQAAEAKEQQQAMMVQKFQASMKGAAGGGPATE